MALKTGTHWRPQVAVIGDNLAVNITWRSQNSIQKPISHYRVQFRQRMTRSQRWSKPYVMAVEIVDGQVFCGLYFYRFV